MLVFIDDSGDPGFKLHTGSSLCFVITLVIFDDNLEAERTSLAIKELRRKLKVADQYEFKFNKMNKRFRKEFLNCVKNFKFRIRAITVQKERVYSQRLRNYKEDFYNYIIMQVLKYSGGLIKKAKLRFDRRGEKSLRDQLRAYLSRELDNKNKNVFTDLKFVDSKENTLIQLADFAAGSININCSGKDRSYLSTFRKAGRVEDIWDFK